MGNSITVKRKRAKVMKIDGETFRIKTPVTAREVTADYPGYVLLDSQAVKHFGVRSKPLEPSQILKPKKTYFLVELPKLPPETTATDSDNKLPYRRVMSGIHVGAKERLEMLMLSRRTVSDVTIGRSDGGDGFGPGLGPGHTSVRLRLPRSQITKLMEENNNDASAIAEKILGIYMERSGELGGGRGGGDSRRKLGSGEIKAREKQVSFAGEGGRELPVLWSRSGK
ncbi:unnamed protein product [Arabidopsis lyrata]|uniref:Plastid movement impaired 2 n=1 Tax=Arabidopsis lyrata subsp. lyrata TaxID=81972 RepID=D7KTQ9_ARALL|nr:uncharacterized protein At1g66480 [Arabidopsis lyrata subsp. lyrata]EFH64761.1 hypothetical protein ARALYDRAFT_475748 [Arabidopsis lyrata subsp. lyrata]CAH8257185.1 unnamed protein product [Arabidopsis lyrata]|eukprot:XP_002888502.1 uncharacterized protein At1g66480 [Arabidopsis lyrata subsp. lyrata]